MARARPQRTPLTDDEREGIVLAVNSAFRKLKNLYARIVPIFEDFGFTSPSAGVIARDLSEKIEKAIIQHCESFSKGTGHCDLTTSKTHHVAVESVEGNLRHVQRSECLRSLPHRNRSIRNLTPFRPAFRLFIEKNAFGNFSQSSIYKSWKLACEDAGMPFFNPYKLGHTWATVLRAEGMDLADVQELLGHTSAKTMARYAMVARPRRARFVQTCK
jgi:hypothetical protein